MANLLSEKIQERTELLEEAKKRFQEKAKQFRKEKELARQSQPQPRYDKIWEEGVDYLNSLAGIPMQLTEEQWKLWLESFDITKEDLDQTIMDMTLSLASNANNGGVPGQIQFLRTVCNLDDRQIQDLLVEPDPWIDQELDPEEQELIQEVTRRLNIEAEDR